MFELKNITKMYGDNVALSVVSLSIKEGMNYIIGASGSGKTTLLNIIAAMDTEYEGTIMYRGQNLKKLSENEKNQFYSTEFGFIAQSFYLIDELSVKENILIPIYLNGGLDENRLNSIMEKLNIKKIEKQKVSTLSGGQKQRVAIARELMKNPRVLIADEPTAALDAKTAQEIGELLYLLSKEITVIVVTHDTSLIQGKSAIFELDKGLLCKSQIDNDNVESKENKYTLKKSRLTITAAINMTSVNLRRQFGKILMLMLTIIFVASGLSVNSSRIFKGSSDEIFAELIVKQGSSILNLDIVSSFMGAGYKDSEGNILGGQSVSQDISHIMEKYKDDSRVESITMLSHIDDIVITLDGKRFIIESSGQAPVFNKIVAGTKVNNSEYEVVLPEILVKKMGRTSDDIIGKEVSFVGSVVNWENSEPLEMPVSFTAKISGIADTSYGIELESKITRFENEDSLFLSLAIMKDIYSQAGIKKPSFSFTIRPTTPESYIEIYDELMSNGIVPLGQIEIIRDIVNLKDETSSQLNASYVLVTGLSIIAILSVCFVYSFMRKREYAIYKLNGYTKNSIVTLLLVEYIAIFLISAIMCAIIANILSLSSAITIFISFGIYVLCLIENCTFALRIKPLVTLKTGGR